MPSRTTAMQKQIYDFFLNCNGKFFFSAPPTTPTVETRHAASLQIGTSTGRRSTLRLYRRERLF